MQKLKILLREKKGSTLVGAVALCTIMALGVAGLMGAARNTVSQEIDAYDDARAFLAAEGGLLMGVNYLELLGNDKIKPIGGQQLFVLTKSNNPTLEDDMEVTVRIEKSPNSNTLNLISTATCEKLPYEKNLQWSIRTTEGICSGCFGQMSDNAQNAPIGKTFEGFQSQTGNEALVFYGEYRSNRPILLYKAGDKVVFKDKVFVFNGPFTSSNKPGYPAPYSINEGYKPGVKSIYSSGVKVSNMQGYNNDNIGTLVLDKVFEGGFEVIDYELEPVINQPVDTLINLPIVSGAGNSNQKSLRFGYKWASGAFQESKNEFTIDGINYPINPNKTTIINAGQQHLTIISGTITGKITVVTEPTFDITINLNGQNNMGMGKTLVYRNDLGNAVYTPTNNSLNNPIPNTNYGIGFQSSENKYSYSGPTNNNLLAIFSGKDINLICPGNGNNLLITAQLFAWNGDITFNKNLSSANKNNVYEIIGVAIQGGWNDWLKSNEQPRFKVYYDERKMNAPGLMYVPKGGSGGGTGGSGPVSSTKLEKSNWIEKNCPKGQGDCLSAI